ncbi:WXG100 family type VII secretion target [Nocardioides sp. SYSU DS0651]|uniref:WXG100 family type VII secretion target n=1 Tax=Nocardioides sp. SYSU DS0651 TaxID=3415955 RepID=UPI003F4B626B
MTDEDEFTVDPAELDQIIAELKTSRRTLGRLLDDLRQQMRTLQATWEGLSADAQAVAQAEWEQGMSEMNDALDDLITANRIAHGNYTGAVRANVAMWQELS